MKLTWLECARSQTLQRQRRLLEANAVMPWVESRMRHPGFVAAQGRHRTTQCNDKVGPRHTWLGMAMAFARARFGTQTS